MERSTDTEIAVLASASQAVTYVYLSMLTILVHEWLILLNREVEYIWKSKWTISKIIYIITRYGPFIDVPIMVAVSVVVQ